MMKRDEEDGMEMGKKQWHRSCRAEEWDGDGDKKTEASG